MVLKILPIFMCLLIYYKVWAADINIVELYETDQLLPRTIFETNQSGNYNINLHSRNVKSEDAFSAMKETCNLLKLQPVAIFGPSSRTNLKIVEDICGSKAIPHILTHWVGDLKEGMQINFYPSIKLLTEAYMDIILYLKWKHFTIVYTNPDDITKFTRILEVARNNDIGGNIEYVDPENVEQIRIVADKLRNSNEKYFVIDCPLNKLENILHFFRTYGLVHKGYGYILITIDIFQTNDYSFLYDYTVSGADIYKLSNYMNFEGLPSHIRNILQNASTIEQALSVDAILVLKEPLMNLQLKMEIGNDNLSCENDNVSNNGEQILNNILWQSFPGATGLIQFGSDRYRSTFSFSIFKVQPNLMQNIGTWDTTFGLSINTSSDTLTSRHFIVEMILVEPYTMLKHSMNTLLGNDRYEGFAVDIIEELSRMSNFTYSIVIREDHIVGSRDPRGRWSGMIGDLLNMRVDMAISDITITSEREEVVDFTYPFMHSGISILFQKPMKAPRSFLEFTAPFSCDLWKGIALAFLTVTASLFIIGRLCKSEWQRQCPNAKHTISQLTFCNTAWFVAGSFLKQNTRVKISSIPGRLIAAVWWFFCVAVVAVYIAGLITYFNSNDREQSVPLFTDLVSLVENAEKHHIKYGTKFSGATMEFFENSDGIFQEAYRHMIEHPEEMVLTVEDGVHKALNEKYAFITESSVIEYVRERYCYLDQYGNILTEKHFGIAVRKNSPYLTSLSTGILKLHTSGILHELKNRWWKMRRGGGQCSDEIPDAEVSPLNLSYVYGLIHMIILGLVLAVTSSIIELLIHSYKLSKVLKIGYCRVFVKEIKGCFKRNVKKAVRQRAPTPNVPEEQGYVPSFPNVADEYVELT